MVPQGPERPSWRSIAQLLSARPPKLVNGPEIFRSWVGESENNIRELFKAAQDDARRLKERSPLHVIIFDEIDAICRSRGRDTGGESNNAAVFDSVVSQVLTMLDGLASSSNVLVIGITNRPELLDPALLRPGRLEVHLEVGLPSVAERLEILQLHSLGLREANYMRADLEALAAQTDYFTGAELESVILNATSIALECAQQDGRKDLEESFCVTDDHLQHALLACEPVQGKELAWLSERPEPMITRATGLEEEMIECSQLLNCQDNSKGLGVLIGADNVGYGTSTALKSILQCFSSEPNLHGALAGAVLVT